jgi:hypothetical protein
VSGTLCRNAANRVPVTDGQEAVPDRRSENASHIGTFACAEQLPETHRRKSWMSDVLRMTARAPVLSRFVQNGNGKEG